MNNWLRNSLYSTRFCALCGLPAKTTISLCAACYQDLPKLHHVCRQCGLPIAAASQYAYCGQCQQSPPPFTETLSAYVYAEPIRPLITRMKFSGNLALAALLGELLRDELQPKINDTPAAILPVPLHKKRLQQRGFNQSIELARPLARQLDIPLLINAVERRVDTPSQTGLSKRQRHANLRHAFHAREPLDYRHVVIVDDVITTGQTITALSRCLRKAGVERVDCWSLARALPANAK